MLKFFYTLSLLVFFCAFSPAGISAQNPSGDNRPCQEDAIVSVAFSGATEISTCTDDDVTDRVRFQVEPFNQIYSYVVVDAGDVIRWIGFSNRINFDLLPGGNLRVYAFSNYGKITASVGDTFSTATLSVPCFGLTANFVSVNNGSSGGILIDSEAPSYSICPGDGIADPVRVSSTASNVTYLITTPDGVLLNSTTDGNLNFDGAGTGTCYVYAFANPGALPIENGDNISELADFTGCGTGISDNFITVVRENVDGGTIRTLAGTASVTLCLGDENAAEVEFISTSSSDADRRLVITNDQDVIIGLPAGFTVDFNDAPAGICRVFNVTFTGTFTAQLGERVRSSALSDGCFDVSAAYVTVNRERVTGGLITAAGGETAVNVCQGDGVADEITFELTSAGSGSSRLVITDDQGTIIGLPDGLTVDFDGAGPGVCRVYLASFTGSFTAETGVQLADAVLADGCFDVSDDFVTVNRLSVDSGTITTADGESSVTTCANDGIADEITFVTNTNSPETNRLVITNDSGEIIGLPDGLTVDFDGAGPGICRVYNVSFTGAFAAQLGDQIGTLVFSDGCFAVSTAFVTVTRESVTGGVITTADGANSVNVCQGDGVADEITFEITSAGGGSSRLVITDDQGTIIGLPDGLTVDFGGAGSGVCRAYVVTFTGSFSAETGVQLADAVFSDRCFGVSDGFVTVNRLSVDGGTIATADGETSISTCPNDGNADEVTFVTTTASPETNRLVITNDNGEIIGLPAGSTVDFDGAGPGICRVYNINFTGAFTAAEGDQLSTALFSDGCFDLSDNFVEVVREVPAGGTILTVDGDSEVETCPGDGSADVVGVVNTGASGGDLVYLITNDANELLNFSFTPSFDLEGAGTGTCRIWSLTYQGDLTITPGTDITAGQLAAGCFELSSDFVTVVRSTPNGGSVATADGDTELHTCPGDGLADSFTFVSTGADGTNFTFIVTDANNNILDIPAGAVVDFEGAGEGVCRLWGLSYAGELTAMAGDNLSSPLSSECSSLSDNFVTVTRTSPTGGTVRLTTGGTSASVCPGDGMADVLSFVNEGGVGENGAWIITDEIGTIIGIPQSASLDFEEVEPGVCRVYSVVYSGELTAAMGMNVSNSMIASGCFALSENFITVTRLTASTGTISTEAGETEILACPGDAIPDAFRFDSTGTTLDNFNYVVTDTNNVVFFVAFTDRIDFEQLPEGVCRVHGLGYNGIIVAEPGDVAGVDPLASQCNALSSNFVTVTKQLPDGGSVSTADGENEVSICTQDGVPDLIELVSTGAVGDNVTYLITDTNNIVLAFVDNNILDFDTTPFGTCRIWCLAYQGELLDVVGADAGADQLASACSDLSDNFVTVTREDVSGGSISVNGGLDAITTCPDDGNADVLNFNSTGATGSNFQYVVTDADNIVLALVEGSTFDFEPAGVGVCRVWGFSYAGESTVMPGDVITDVPLANGCAALADNFITVTREVPFSGAVTLADGSTSADVCSGVDSEPALEFVSGPSAGDYIYIIVQADSFALLGIMDTFNFNMAQAGNYAVYGLAYSGNLSLFPGQNIFTTDLATSCFDLSDNFVTVNVERVDGGDILGNNAEELYFCPDNPDDGLVRFSTNSGESDTLYRYVIATTTDVIINVVPAGQDSFDFGSLPLQELKVWAISYTGEFQAGPGSSLQFSQLATGCVALSSNCIRILNDSPEAGEISFDDVPGTGIACTSNGDGTISVSTTSDNLTGYAVLVTDTSNVVQLVALDPTSVDLGSLPEGPYRVYGLAYTGTVTVAPGDDITVVALADNCYELTTTFLDVTQGGVIDAGFLTNITTEGTGDTINFCLADGDVPIAVVEASVTGANYRYIITDEDGRIRATNLPSNIIPFQALGQGTYRIYGFNYTGVSLAGINQNINTTILSSGCSALTTNFITVVFEDADGGEITTVDGETEIEIEIAGSGADATAIVAFETMGASGENFIYVVTDEMNGLLAVTDGPSIDFGPAGVGVCRVWALSYSGEIIAGMGDDAAATVLTDGCYDLSDNFVTVTRVDEVGFTDNDNPDEGAGSVSALLMTARPNPASGSVLYLDLESLEAIPGGQLYLRDMNGISYGVQTLTGGDQATTVQIDISQLPSGMYFVQLASQQGMQSVRFMKD